MDCKRNNGIILKYIDKELDAEQNQLFEEHVASCVRCKKALDDLMRIYGEIEVEKSEYADNPFLAQKIWNRINSRENATHPSGITIRRIAITSLVAAGLFIGVLIGTLVNSSILTNSTEEHDQNWAMVSEEYFPMDIFKPFE